MNDGKGARHNFSGRMPNRERLLRHHVRQSGRRDGGLPAPGLQHLRVIQPGDRQALHCSDQVLADFK